MSKLPIPIQKLIIQLKKLPGVGSKTAERYIFDILSWEDASLQTLATSLASLKQEIEECTCCGCLKSTSSCEFCDPCKRDPHQLCVLPFSKDVYPIEEARAFKGMYHVLGGTLSPSSGYTTENLNIKKLQDRILHSGIKDLVLALDATLEGDATAFFLKEALKGYSIQISRLAFGIPLGSPLEYVDPGTLSRAFAGRHPF